MQERGVYGKYKIERVDGKPMKPGFRFVLSPENDHAALEALKTYANHTANQKLATELKDIVLEIERLQRESDYFLGT